MPDYEDRARAWLNELMDCRTDEGRVALIANTLREFDKNAEVRDDHAPPARP